jgi:hypothetical protein
MLAGATMGHPAFPNPDNSGIPGGPARLPTSPFYFLSRILEFSDESACVCCIRSSLRATQGWLNPSCSSWIMLV